MVEIVSCIVKLVSWAVLAARSRWGFLLAAVGEIAAALVLVQVGLYWLAGYSLAAAVIQTVGYFNWKQKMK
jgi:hypothetical protein